MATGIRITGLETLQKKLTQDLVKDATQMTYKGLVRAGMAIVRDAVPGAPIETGNLRQSAYVIGHSPADNMDVKREAKGNPARGPEEVAAVQQEFVIAKAYVASWKAYGVLIGFAASYAGYVHEGDPTYNWHNGGPQYLHNAVMMNYDNIIRLCKEEITKI
jgi:hypothetical protein